VRSRQTAASAPLRHPVYRGSWPTAVWLLISGGWTLSAQHSSAQLNETTTLAAVAARHLSEGEHEEAEVIADSLLKLDPESRVAWELIGTSRYLQDDSRGALRAWGRAGRPQVGGITISFLGKGGEVQSPDGSSSFGLVGLRHGDLLTVDRLIQGERRLRSLPAAASARLDYRMQADGAAHLSGVLVLDGPHPFPRPEMAAHTLRLLVGRLHLRSANALGNLEAWEMSARISKNRYSAAVSLAHPTPFGHGVWKWTIDREEGSRATMTLPTGIREERTGIEWRHTDWIAARVRGSVLGRVDRRGEGGTAPGAGMALTFVPLNEQSEITLDGTIWSGSRERSEFGQLSILATRYPPTRTSPGGPSGMAARLGVLTVSSGAPTDLTPLFGAGGQADIALRAHRELDRDGVAIELLPGTAWIHGGIELLHSIGAIGPLGIGAALFADGAGVLPGSEFPSNGNGESPRRAALSLGGGMRARITGISGWLRVDWGINPADGVSTLSAGWVAGGAS